MPLKYSDAITSARQRIQDEDSTAYRWADDKLLAYAKDGIAEMFDIRPDIFMGLFLTLDLTFPSVTVNSDLPMPPQYKPLLSEYIVYRAMSEDNEQAEIGKSNQSAQWMAKRLLG